MSPVNEVRSPARRSQPINDEANLVHNTLLLRTPALLQHIIWPTTRLILKFFTRFRVIGLENLENLPPGVIFAANHSSEIDPIVIPAALPFMSQHFGMFYTSREQSFYKRSGWRQKFYGGTLFKLWGAYPVKVGVHNYEASLGEHIRLLEHHKSVCIFPEGRKTDTGELQEGKGGMIYLAHKTGKPIVPVFIEGVFKLSFLNFFFMRRRITVNFGKPLYIGNLLPQPQQLLITAGHDDCREGAQKIMTEIKALRTHSTA